MLDENKNMIKVLFVVTNCKSCGPIQQTLNIIKNLDINIFEPILLTIYPEPIDGTSKLNLYLKYVKHHYVPLGKFDIIIGRYEKLEEMLEKINPDIIHSTGAFPDFTISRIGKYNHLITLRNFVWDDYPDRYGYIFGNVLAYLHIYAMQLSSKTVTCSESLSNIYKNKLNMDYDFVRNGVDTVKFRKTNLEEQVIARKELDLPEDAFIFVYVGPIIGRKNVRFLLEGFLKVFERNSSCILLLLGKGEDLEQLKNSFRCYQNIIFQGSVDNVSFYLKACNAYVSCSKSEGMPNGVLEAMATGIPVILSDIEQHKEIFSEDNMIGYLYEQNNIDDLCNKMMMLYTGLGAVGTYRQAGEKAYSSANKHFSSIAMSESYQKVYLDILKYKRKNYS